ncbi:Flp pilus assembly protein CpaB [Thalassovita autumnalis]|uniref:Flp pilus assembly protein CpaB n=1 Tax=Thalassovita autumnalis TaxID=2072972 RepID=A0A0N7LY00_9RHOB|nr:Flp pilus assembly protein CpaB [Thalassovita autumnalis]CUH68068.1 Flp pilus assembly protein CpaB [Thalassovita autumnalis]CUH73332.1 Flp pilus assembly protein CpaB [Thalassovita autumnalis]
MRAVFGLVLVVGLGLAGFAVYMVQNYIAGYQAQLAQARNAQPQVVEMPTVNVYVAKRQLKYGEPLTDEDVYQIKWPKEALPEGFFSETEKLFPNPSDPNLRRVVLRQMEVNEPVLALKVTKPGQDAGLTSRLERGQRAFAIKVDVASGVSGFLRPGDRVDVYWTGTTALGNDARREFTKLIESSVALIAVDQTTNDDDATASIARTVTVAATPAQVAALAQAQSTGRLSLSLVGARDDTIAEQIEIDQRGLLGIVETPREIRQAEVEPQICTIRTRRGAEVVEIPIPCSN